VPESGLLRFLHLSLHDQSGYLPAKTGGEGNQTLTVLL